MTWKKFRKKLKWLDPFTYVDLYVLPKVNPKDNEAINWVVYLASAFLFAWLIYTGLGLVFGTESPMMIVVSGSMEPLYHRGDVILLHGAGTDSINSPEVVLDFSSLEERELASFAELIYSNSAPKQIEAINFDSGQNIPITQEGDIVVYWSERMNEPVVHRTVAKLRANDGVYFLTKGDSVYNTTVDQDCGMVINGQPQKPCIELYPTPLKNLQGKAFFQIPLLGCVKLWLLDDLGSLIATGKLPNEFREGNVC